MQAKLPDYLDYILINVTSHTLRIHAWEHILFSMQGIHEHHAELKKKNVTSFGQISLEEIKKISEIYLELRFDEIYLKFYNQWTSLLTEYEVSDIASKINSLIDQIIRKIDSLSIPNIWHKINSFYHWEIPSLKLMS